MATARKALDRYPNLFFKVFALAYRDGSCQLDFISAARAYQIRGRLYAFRALVHRNDDYPLLTMLVPAFKINVVGTCLRIVFVGKLQPDNLRKLEGELHDKLTADDGPSYYGTNDNLSTRARRNDGTRVA